MQTYVRRYVRTHIHTFMHAYIHVCTETHTGEICRLTTKKKHTHTHRLHFRKKAIAFVVLFHDICIRTAMLKYDRNGPPTAI